MVTHLGLGDWQRIEIGDELDLLGDAACDALRRHGLLWPPNAYFPAPVFRVARGGCVLNGFDGDGLFGAWPWARAQAVLHRRLPLRPTDVARIGWAVAPVPVRRLVETRRALAPITWLHPRAERRFAREWRGRKASEPRRWDRRLQWYSRWRFLHLGVHSLSLVAGDYGSRSVSPFADRQFIAALAREGGPAGFGDRSGALRAVFGDVLPRELIERRSKAEFGRAIWRGRALEFASRWDGSGVDPDLVDADRLRAAWAADNPAFGSATLLHGAWLASDPS
jgi:asparagine synthase (glutamine-hydrolysing)